MSIPSSTEHDSQNIGVYQTLLVKELRAVDGRSIGGDDLRLVGTLITRTLLPTPNAKAMPKEWGGGFEYRVNEEVFHPQLRKRRIVKAADHPSAVADVATYAISVPLETETIFEHYPFRIQFAGVKLELSSFTVPAGGKEKTLRPDLQYVRGSPGSLVTIKSVEGLDRMGPYDMASETPVVYGVREFKQGINPYTPIVVVGFYLTDPALVAFTNMLLPILLILVVLTSALVHDVEFFRDQLANMVLALIFALPTIRKMSSADTRFSPTDLFIILIFLGMGIASTGSLEATRALWVGMGVAWSGLLVPLVGALRYWYALRTLEHTSSELDFARKSETNKRKGDDFTVGDLALIPDATAVMNSPRRAQDKAWKLGRHPKAPPMTRLPSWRAPGVEMAMNVEAADNLTEQFGGKRPSTRNYPGTTTLSKQGSRPEEGIVKLRLHQAASPAPQHPVPYPPPAGEESRRGTPRAGGATEIL